MMVSTGLKKVVNCRQGEKFKMTLSYVDYKKSSEKTIRRSTVKGVLTITECAGVIKPVIVGEQINVLDLRAFKRLDGRIESCRGDEADLLEKGGFIV
jgi:hypothetical protein